MNTNYKILIGLSIIVGLVACSAEEEADPTANFSIEQIAGDLYKASTISHRTLFLVTEDGVILTDPINREFSTWLRSEIDQRFGVPVRYVLYTHHHWDHASGGGVFDDTATFIGHANMPNRLALPPADTQLPADAEGLDTNGDERISMEEAEGTYAATFDLYDYDRDGFLTGAEATRGRLNDVRAPDLTYEDELSVTLGGKTAKMVYTGVHTHTDDMAVIVFPEESVGFMADFISIIRPPRFIQGDQPIETWLAAVRIVEAQGFDIAVGGHGAHADSVYVTLFREYLEELRDQVAAGIAAGTPVEELQANIYMEEYADWISYDEFRESNILDMYNILTREF